MARFLEFSRGMVGLWMVDNEVRDEIEMTGRVVDVEFFR